MKYPDLNLSRYLKDEKISKKKLGVFAASALLIGGALGGAGYGIAQGINAWNQPTAVINSGQGPIENTPETTPNLQGANGNDQATVNLPVADRTTNQFDTSDYNHFSTAVFNRFQNRVMLEIDRKNEDFDIIKFTDPTNDENSFVITSFNPFNGVHPTTSEPTVIQPDTIGMVFMADTNSEFWTGLYDVAGALNWIEMRLTAGMPTVGLDVEVIPTQNVSFGNPQINPSIDSEIERQAETREIELIGIMNRIYNHFNGQADLNVRIASREIIDGVEAHTQIEIRIANSNKIIIVEKPNLNDEVMTTIYKNNRFNSIFEARVYDEIIDYIETEITIAKQELEARTNPRNAVPATEVGAEEQGAVLDNSPQTEIDTIRENVDIDFLQEAFSEELLAGQVLGLDFSQDKMTMEILSSPLSSSTSTTCSDCLVLKFTFLVDAESPQDLNVSKVELITKNQGSQDEISKLWSITDQTSPANQNLSRTKFDAIKILWTNSVAKLEVASSPAEAPASPVEQTPVNTMVEEGANLDNEGSSQPEVLESTGGGSPDMSTPDADDDQDSDQDVPAPDVDNQQPPVAPTSMTPPSAGERTVIPGGENQDNEDQDEDEDEAPVIGGDGNDQVAGMTLPWTQSSLSGRIKQFFTGSPGWTVTESRVGTPATNPELRVQKGDYFFKIEFWQQSIKYQFKQDIPWWKVWKGVRDPVLNEQIFTYDNANALFGAIAHRLTTPIT